MAHGRPWPQPTAEHAEQSMKSTSIESRPIKQHLSVRKPSQSPADCSVVFASHPNVCRQAPSAHTAARALNFIAISISRSTTTFHERNNKIYKMA